MSNQRPGVWLITAVAVAVSTGVVIGQQVRGNGGAAAPPPSGDLPFRLGQSGAGPDAAQPGSAGSPGNVGPGQLGVMPFAGRVTSVDTGSSTLTVVGPSEAGTRTVRVTPQTVIVRQEPGRPGDLKIGDTVFASGMPRAIEVERMRALQLSPATLARAGTIPIRSGGGLTALFGGGPDGGGAHVQGTITSLTPLKIAFGDGLECALTLKSGATVARVLDANLADVKPGDTLLGLGQVGADGAVAALHLAIGLEPPGGRDPIGGLRQRLRSLR